MPCVTRFLTVPTRSNGCAKGVCRIHRQDQWRSRLAQAPSCCVLYLSLPMFGPTNAFVALPPLNPSRITPVYRLIRVFLRDQAGRLVPWTLVTGLFSTPLHQFLATLGPDSDGSRSLARSGQHECVITIAVARRLLRKGLPVLLPGCWQRWCRFRRECCPALPDAMGSMAKEIYITSAMASSRPSINSAAMNWCGCGR